MANTIDCNHTVRYGLVSMESWLLKWVRVGVRYHNVWTNVMFGTVINLHSSFLTVSYGRLESPEGMWFSSWSTRQWGLRGTLQDKQHMLYDGQVTIKQKWNVKDANSGDVQKLTFYSVNMFCFENTILKEF